MGLDVKNLDNFIGYLETHLSEQAQDVVEDVAADFTRDLVLRAFELSAKYTGSFSSSWRVLLSDSSAPRFSSRFKDRQAAVRMADRAGEAVISEAHEKEARSVVLTATQKTRVKKRLAKLDGGVYQFYVVNVDPSAPEIEEKKAKLRDGPEGSPSGVVSNLHRFALRRIESYGFK